MRNLRIEWLSWRTAWLGLWLGATGVMWSWNSEFRLSDTLLSPSWSHPFGADAFGRNTLLLTLKASGASFGLALASVTLVFALGLVLCAVIALAPGWSRFAFKRGLEFLLALPSLLLALGFAAVRGPGWETLVVAMLLGTLPGFLRLLVARAEEILREDYVLASRSIGSSGPGLFLRHLLPGILSFASVKIPNLLAGALVAEASLSFMGIGAPLGSESWGLLLAQGRDYLLEAPQIAIVSGIPLILTVSALQQLSEGLFQSLPNRDRIPG